MIILDSPWSLCTPCFLGRYTPGVPEKAKRWIFSTLQAKSIIFVYVIISNIFHRKEWYQDHYIWLDSFDSMPISWNTVIFIFSSIFATDERRIMPGIAFHYNAAALGNPVSWHVSTGFPKTQQWKAILNIILRSSVAKTKRNLKITVF